MLALLIAATDSKSSGGSVVSLLFLPLMFILLYFVLIRPQQKRAKVQRQLQKQVEIGDEIITSSGIYGIITAMDEEDLWLEVADGVEFRIARGAVMRVTQSAVETEEDSN
jgi:preprotein translocase subunit YajC